MLKSDAVNDNETRAAGEVEFDCRACLSHVFLFGATAVPSPPLCGVCAWIDEHVPDPAERVRIRALCGLTDEDVTG